MATALEDDFDWNNDAAVGIDLGTTYSCVSVYQDGRINVIRDENGHKLVPSVVAFESHREGIRRLVGREATENEEIDQSHVVTEVKRLIGRKFDETAVQNNMKRWHFQVTANAEGNAQVNMYLDGQPDRQFSPEDVSSSILSRMKKIAENHLKKEVTHEVITVPAYFNDAQRTATLEAAKLANLEVLAIINEPSAGALAYGVRSKVTRKRIILVIDIGGGTSDVALIEVVGEELTVLTCKGDNNLGGEDFVTNLVNYCVEQIKEKVTFGKPQMRRLRNKCEQAKRKLSENPADPNWQYDLELEEVLEGIDLTLPISRKKFEEINQNLFDRAIGLVPACLEQAKLSIEDVNDIVPVGGSMRIPKLREMLQNMFEGKRLYDSINPDEAIAVGASILAAKKLGTYCGHLMLGEVTPFSLGVKIGLFDEMFVIIPANTKIPCEKLKCFHTLFPFQTAAEIVVYQGENIFVEDNMLLGKFRIEGLKPKPLGISKSKIDVTLKVDENGILKVTAREVDAEKENVVTGELDTLLPHLNMLSVSRVE